MAICSHCGGEMTEGISCLTDPVVIDGLSRPGHRLRLRDRARLHVRSGKDRSLPLPRAAAGRLALIIASPRTAARLTALPPVTKVSG